MAWCSPDFGSAAGPFRIPEPRSLPISVARQRRQPDSDKSQSNGVSHGNDSNAEEINLAEESTAAAGSSRKRSLSSTVKSKRFRDGKTARELLADVQARASSEFLELWDKKHSPQNKSELAVNPRKIAEVEAWMKDAQNNGKLLVLTGPAGSGRSATVKAIAKEAKVKLSEWKSSTYAPFDKDTEERTYYEPQDVQFDHFLHSSNRRSVMEDAAEATATIVLLEELPESYARNPVKFHDLIRRNLNAKNTIRLVFILTEDFAGNSRFYTMFPASVVSQLAITVINFNPITSPSMRKALTAISRKELAGTNIPVPTEKIEELATSGRGDLRACLTSLQFYCAAEKSRKRKPAGQKIIPMPVLSDMRDQSLLLFRAVGRAFYVKRNVADPINSFGLPPSLFVEARRPLTYVPEDIVEHCSTSNDNFNAFLHENYSYFVQDLSLLERATETFSVADLVSSNWMSRDQLQSCTSSIIIRGLLHLQRAEFKQQYHPVEKPAATAVWKKVQERKSSAQSVINDISPCVRTSVIFGDLMPFLGKIIPSWNTSDQHTFLRDIGTFPDVPRHFCVKREVLKEDEWYDARMVARAKVKPSSEKPTTQPGSDTGLEDQLSQTQIQADDSFFPEAVNFDLPSSSQSTREYDTSDVMIEEDDDAEF
ncbi:hypothetical protein RvY_14705 [Ramazzottius varieornatus]|uniref:Cell cycle checkpoint protein RAD17 n=1 Tax=Ramazzottius varieornatus TaxID=947166 RepID=A0A1D1VSD1_RAMVA|nr:hypothetical protein RvY_14705 [Ramazzottius varieornatus]